MAAYGIENHAGTPVYVHAKVCVIDATAVAVAAAALLIDGIYFDGPVHGQEELRRELVPLLLVSLILGVVTSFVKPLLAILSIPLIFWSRSGCSCW